MSSSIDERIVRLGFDNAKFEAGAAKSMSTIDKLKEKLQFKGAEEGAKNLDRSINGIDFSGMLKGIESVEKRFSVMGIAGMTVVSKITDAVINGAKKLEQATIGQITSGGWSRAMNLANAQFQIEGLGEDWNEMQKAISYGVKDTAYGLDAAATAASSLVASGVAYKESIDGANDSLMHTSLRAISGVAAMTNSSYEDISRVFTTVAGNGRLMGDQLLQLSARGMNAAATLATALGKTESEIRDMVSHGQIDFETFATAMDDAFGAHAKEANKTFTGALSNMKAALSRFGAVFTAPIIEKTNTLFISLTDRIDELKSRLEEIKVPRSIDELHEKLDRLNLSAAGFDAASKAISEKTINLGEDFAAMWQSGIDAFSALIESVDLSWFDKIVEKVDTVTNKVKFFFDTLTDYLKGSSDDNANAVEDATKTLLVSAEEAEAAKRVIEGAYGTGLKRKEALLELFKDSEDAEQHAANVQAYVDSIVAAGWSYEKAAIKIADANDEIADSEETIAKKDKIKKSLETIKKVLSNTWKITKNIGKSAKKIGSAIFKAFENIFKIDFDSVNDGVSGFSDTLANLSEKLIISDETAEKITKVFEFFFSIIKKGGSVLVNAAKNAKDFFSEFKDTKLFEKLSDGFHSFSDAVTNSGVFKWISDKITSLLDTTNDYDFFSNIKDKFISLSNMDFEGVFAGIKETITGAFEAISDIKLPEEFTDNSFVSAITTFFTEISEIINGESSLPDKIGDFLRSILDAISNIDWEKTKSNVQALLSILIIYRIMQMLNSISKFIDAVVGIPAKISAILGGIAKIFTEGALAITKMSSAATFKMVAAAIFDIVISLLILSQIPEQDLYTAVSVVVLIAGILKVLTTPIKNIGQSGVSISTSIKPVLKLNARMLGLGLAIIGIAGIIASVAALVHVLDGVKDVDKTLDSAAGVLIALSAVFIGIAIILNIMANSLSKNNTNAMTLIPIAGSLAIVLGALSASMLIIAGAILALATISDADKLQSAAEIMQTLAGELTVALALLIAMASINTDHYGLNTKGILALSVLFVAFSSAITILVGAVLALSVMFAAEEKGFLRVSDGMLAIGAAIALMIGGIALIIYALGKAGTENIKGMATGILAIAAMVGVIAYAISKLADNMSPDMVKIANGLAWIIVAIGAALTAIILAFSHYSEMTVAGDPGDVLLGIGAAFLMVAASMLILAVAMEKMVSLGDGIKTAGIAMGIFAGAIILLAVFAAIFSSFGAALTAVGTAFLFAGVGMALAGASVLLISVAFSIFTKALAAFVPYMEQFFTTLEAHKAAAIAVGVFAIAVIALLVVGIIQLVQIIKPIVELITTAISTILEALSKFTNKTEKGSDKFSKKMSTKTKAAVIGIMGGILAAIVSMTPEMLDTLGLIIIKVLHWLGSIAGDIVDGLLDFIINVLYGLADAIYVNGPRIANALVSVVAALYSLILDVLAEFMDNSAVVDVLNFLGFDISGDMLRGRADDLMERAHETREAAEELADSRRELLGMENRVEEAANTSIGDIGKSFLGIDSSSSSGFGGLLSGYSDTAKASDDSTLTQVKNIEALKKQYDSLPPAGQDAMLKSLTLPQNKAALLGAEAGEEWSDASIEGMLNGDLDIEDFMSQKNMSTDDFSDYGSDAGDSFNEYFDDAAYDPDGMYGVTDANISDGAIDAIEDNKNNVQDTTRKNITGAMKTTVEDGRGSMHEAGMYTIAGLVQAIRDQESNATGAMSELVAAIKAQYEMDMDQHSPSKVFYQNGKYLVMGLANGIEKSTELATDSMSTLSDAIIVSFGAPLDYVAKIASGELVYDPSIRPVIDPSSVRSGARNINSMIDSQTIQLSGYSGQLAADIGRLDNSNLMVVEELRQLRADMADMTEQITNMQMVMDTGALVGQISGPIDQTLGRNAIRKGRGN